MTPRRARREHDATEMIPGGRNGRRSVAGRRTARPPADTRVLEPVRELSPAQQIDAALERQTAPIAAVTPSSRPQSGQEPARQALSRLAQEAQAAGAPRFTPSRGLPAPFAPPPSVPRRPALPASRPGPAAPGPVRFTGELPAFAAVAAEMTLPSLLWCAGCGRDFTDDETAKFDRVLQFLHVRAAETGWRRDAYGLMRCPQCQQSRWVAAWRPPVLAGGVRAELALRESVEGPLPAGRRAHMSPPEITFDGLPEEAVTVTRDDEGPRVRVDWESVIASPQRAAGPQGGRHRKQPGLPPEDISPVLQYPGYCACDHTLAGHYASGQCSACDCRCTGPRGTLADDLGQAAS